MPLGFDNKSREGAKSPEATSQKTCLGTGILLFFEGEKVNGPNHKTTPCLLIRRLGVTMKNLIPVLPFLFPADTSAARKGVYYLHQSFFKDHLPTLRLNIFLTSHDHNRLENSVIGLKQRRFR
jgi:hypothetical protein